MPLTALPRARRSLFALILALTAWGAISLEARARARTMWPIREGDSVWFMPPIVSYARGEGLINPFPTVAKMWDPAGRNRFVGHGFLGQMVIGKLSPPSYRGVVATTTAIGILALLLGAFLFWLLLPAGASGLARMLPAAAVLAFSNTALGNFGRPEPFVVLLLTAGLLLARIKPRARRLIAGVTLGVLGCSHPVASILVGLLVASALLWERAPKEALLEFARIALIAFAAAAPLFYWFPYDLRSWILGNLAHSRAAVIGTWKASPLQPWLLSYSSFFAGPLFLYAAVRAAWRLRGRWKEAASGPWFALSVLAFAAAGWYTGIRVVTRSYNLLLLAPLVLGFLVYDAAGGQAAGDNTARQDLDRQRPRNTIFVALMIFLLAFAGGFLRKALVRWTVQRSSASYDEARDRLLRLRSESNGPVLITQGFFTLADDARDVEIWKPGTPAGAGRRLMLEQAFSGLRRPPELAGFTLVEEHFSGARSVLWGLRLSSNVPAYNWAIYVAR